MNFEEIRDKYFYLVYRMQERYGLDEEGLAELTITYLETIERNLWKVGIYWSTALRTRLDRRAQQLCCRTVPEVCEPYYPLQLAYEDVTELCERHIIVENLLSILYPMEKRVICLRYYDGLSRSECGEVCGLTAGQVRNLEAQAIRRMRSRAWARSLPSCL